MILAHSHGWSRGARRNDERRNTVLRSFNDLRGYKMSAQDADLGSVWDLLFDDERWVVRYLVVTTGPWRFGRLAVIARERLGRPDWPNHLFPVDLTRNQIKNAPDLDEAAPVSRRIEQLLLRHYGLDPYWVKALPSGSVRDLLPVEEAEQVHLRSSREITGYHVAAADGELGHVEDLIGNVETWTVEYLVVDTRNWLPGHKVLVPTSWFDRFDWLDRQVTTKRKREELEHAPTYDPSAPVNEELERRVYDYFGRPVA